MVAYCVAVASERLPPAAAERATPSCAAVAMAAAERQTRRETPAPRAPTAFSAPKRVADARLRAGLAGDQRQAAVVVQEEQAELGAVVEVRREVLEVEAVLAAVGRPCGRQAVHGLEVGDVAGRRAGGSRRPGRRTSRSRAPRLLPPVGAKSLLLK